MDLRLRLCVAKVDSGIITTVLSAKVGLEWSRSGRRSAKSMYSQLVILASVSVGLLGHQGMNAGGWVLKGECGGQ